MENNSYTTSDRLDYLEFRQNLLILKQPCHKATVFFDLTIDIYLKMKEKSEEFSENVKNGKNLKLLDYEKITLFCFRAGRYLHGSIGTDRFRLGC